MNPKQKLELTWIGKDQRPKLEPRILLEDTTKSYHAKQRVSEADIFDNRLIFGDNLLALKALEQEFTGKVKCVFIDPPYNTGSAFTHYDDGLEHSIWLGLMRDRLEIIRRLLAEDGSLWITIDDNEAHYLKVLCDEIFGRVNFVTTICVKMSHLSGVKMSHIEKKIPKLKEFVLVYARQKTTANIKPVYVQVDWDKSFDRYNQFIENKNEDMSTWSVIPLKMATRKAGIEESDEVALRNFIVQNSSSIFRTARNKSFLGLENVAVFKEITTKTGLVKIVYKGEEVLFVSNKLNHEHGEPSLVVPLGDMWMDIGINNLHNEGGVEFRNSKKPEMLIQRILEMASNEGDLILDSFAGSGTTGAVAHKMRRRWIMVELGEHCHTHIIPRLQKVIDGTDKGGVTQATGWQGGGGFRYYRLAPTLIVNDRWGNPVINPSYNAAQLAEALAKLEGFSYAPSEVHWWQHGYSSERDFIYVTTQNLSAAQLQALSDEVGAERSLLVCCAAFHGVTASQAAERWLNLTLKKIPKMVLARCEWGHDDYSLNVANLPMSQPTPPAPVASKTRAKLAKQHMGDLFDTGEESGV